jgi:hypothetical protein
MVVGGTGLVFVAGTPLFAFFGRLFDRAFWPRTPDTATRQFEAWIYSVLGATIAGWGLCLALVVANAFPTHQAWAWRAVAAGVAL